MSGLAQEGLDTSLDIYTGEGTSFLEDLIDEVKKINQLFERIAFLLEVDQE